LTGNVVVTAKGPTYRDLDESSVIAVLAGKSLAGTGPHTWYKKTWEAGLAYGNGLDVRPREGIILYYADRCPSVRATLAFIRAMAEEGSQPPMQSSAVDYALAQIFAFSRTALSPSARAEAMAIDLREGLTPERLQRFSQILRRLRSDPQLLQRLRDTLPRVMATVTLGPEHRALQSAAQVVFFVIAPESQLAELEGDIPANSCRACGPAISGWSEPVQHWCPHLATAAPTSATSRNVRSNDAARCCQPLAGTRGSRGAEAEQLVEPFGYTRLIAGQEHRLDHPVAPSSWDASGNRLPSTSAHRRASAHSSPTAAATSRTSSGVVHADGGMSH
jgi:hypothetical protein